MRAFLAIILYIMVISFSNVETCNASKIIGDIDWEHLENSKVYPKYDTYIENGNQKYINLILEYPLIYVASEEVQKNINKDIAGYVYNFKNQYDNGMFYRGKMSYEKFYEDTFRISIVLKETWWNIGAAHSQYRFIGVVYDKLTGEKVSVRDYMPNISSQNLNLVVENGIAPLINEQGNKINIQDGKTINRVSNDFVIVDMNTIALIYQPYELAPFSDGIIYLVLNEKIMDYINRLNKR